jgi:hypothetical protein
MHNPEDLDKLFRESLSQHDWSIDHAHWAKTQKMVAEAQERRLAASVIKKAMLAFTIGVCCALWAHEGRQNLVSQVSLGKQTNSENPVLASQARAQDDFAGTNLMTISAGQAENESVTNTRFSETWRDVVASAEPQHMGSQTKLIDPVALTDKPDFVGQTDQSAIAPDLLQGAATEYSIPEILMLDSTYVVMTVREEPLQNNMLPLPVIELPRPMRRLLRNYLRIGGDVQLNSGLVNYYHLTVGRQLRLSPHLVLQLGVKQELAQGSSMYAPVISRQTYGFGFQTNYMRVQPKMLYAAGIETSVGYQKHQLKLLAGAALHRTLIGYGSLMQLDYSSNSAVQFDAGKLKTGNSLQSGYIDDQSIRAWQVPVFAQGQWQFSSRYALEARVGYRFANSPLMLNGWCAGMGIIMSH